MRGQRRRPWVHHQAEGSNYRTAAFAAAAVALLLLCAANTINYHHATVTPHRSLTTPTTPPRRRVARRGNSTAGRALPTASTTLEYRDSRERRVHDLLPGQDTKTGLPPTHYVREDGPMARRRLPIDWRRPRVLRDRTNWWLERREAVPLGPRENLVAPRGGGHRSRKGEFLGEVFARGSRDRSAPLSKRRTTGSISTIYCSAWATGTLGRTRGATGSCGRARDRCATIRLPRRRLVE